MYVKIISGSVDEYPYTVEKLRKDNPNTSFPKSITDSMLADWGVYPVTQLDAPSITVRTKTNTLNAAPTLVDSVWTLGWTTSDKTSDETATYDAEMANDNRAVRNDRLSDTDFYALSDVTMSSDMATYRQALRDLPSHSNWPNLASDDWPTKP